jgi:hypothetical protein
METQYYQQKHLQKTFHVQIPKLSVKRIKQSILTRVIEKRNEKILASFFPNPECKKPPLFIQKQTDNPKQKTARQKPSKYSPPSVPCIKMRLKKTKFFFSSTKTETKSDKQFQGEGKTYQKFVASRISCNAESGETVGEWSLFSPLVALLSAAPLDFWAL